MAKTQFAIPHMGGERREGASAVDEIISGAVALRESAAAKRTSASPSDPRAALRALADKLPDPASLPSPSESAPNALSSQETDLRAALEAAVDTAASVAQDSVWLAGKALSGISQARLHRETHSTFADYVEDRFGISRSHAYRWMAGWSTALAVAPAGAQLPTEKHVRALLKAGKTLGADGVVTLYQAADSEAQAGGGKLTAAMLDAAADALPAQLPSVPEQAEQVVRQAAIEAVRQVLAAPRIPQPGKSAEGAPAGRGGSHPAEQFRAELRGAMSAVGAAGLGVTVASELGEDGRGVFLRGFVEGLDAQEVTALLHVLAGSIGQVLGS